MAIRMGKIQYEVICPLCQTIWFLEDNEWHLVAGTTNKSSFYCPECENDIIVSTGDIKPIKAYDSVNEVYGSWLFYNNYMEE